MAGVKPKEKVKIIWSPNFAYALGLLATDGCLSKDGRHFDFTSKDKSQIKNFLTCLGINNRIGIKVSGYSGKKYFRIQFGDVMFYRFLLLIGFTPAKSKTIGALGIPQKYFFDFLRGSFDGDGTFFSYWDPRWKSSFMFYTAFVSASRDHIDWLRDVLRNKTGVNGHVTYGGRGMATYQLKYAKNESMKILKRIYPRSDVVCLKRKRLKIEKALSIIGASL